MICDECRRTIKLKEKTPKQQYVKLLDYISNADRDGAFNYFKLCLKFAGGKNDG